MFLAFNTNAYVKVPIEEVMRSLALFGYKGIEIARTHPVHEMSDVIRKQLREMARELGLTICAIQGATPYLDMDYARQRIDLAVELDCHLVNLGCGALVTDPDKREKYWADFLENLFELTKYAAARDRVVVVEAEPPEIIPGSKGYMYCERLLGKTDDLERVVSEIRMDNLGILLDIGHLYVMEENPFCVIKKLKGKIFHIHIEDIVDRVHCHFVPGKGEVDFAAILKLLKHIGYRGFVSVELGPHTKDPDRAALQSIEYLEGLFYKLDLI